MNLAFATLQQQDGSRELLGLSQSGDARQSQSQACVFMTSRESESEQEDMVALIRKVVQESLQDLLPSTQASTQADPVRPAKCRSEPEVRSEGDYDAASQDSSDEGDKPVFYFALVNPFVQAV